MRIFRTIFYSALFILLPTPIVAQGLTLSSQSTTTAILPSGIFAWSLVVVRVALGIAFLLAGFILFKSGYNWLFWEGNPMKAKDGKETLSNALIFTSILFVLAVLFKLYIGDYSLLTV